MKRIIFCFLSLLLLITSMILITTASEADYSDTVVTAEGFDYPQYLSDRNEISYADNEGLSPSTITVTNSNGIHHLYVIFDKIYGECTLSDPKTQKTVTVGKNSFLHEYIDVLELFESAPTELTMNFDKNAYVADVYAFSKGDLPSWVQKWEAPLEKADILLLSSHSDDEQLFLGGILPYYAGERGADVQVVYLVNHFDTHSRPHEQLNGLWTVGVKNYPVISEFPDLYSESLDSAISAFKSQGYTYEDFTDYIVENIRRFKPQVLITHDIKGEYGHGTHIYCTDVVMNALPSISDPSFCPESANKHGVWDVPKTYFHLYEENKITMNWDVPLSAFNGKTAFEMTVEGFAFHKSQHWTWFNDWIHGKAGSPVTKATDIKSYSPCEYGLYRTTVGNDVNGGDFLENIVLYKDQLPPETIPPETEKAPETTKNPTTTAADKNNIEKSHTQFSSKILIVMLIGVVVLIIIFFIIFTLTKPRKRNRPKYSRYR